MPLPKAESTLEQTRRHTKGPWTRWERQEIVRLAEACYAAANPAALRDEAMQVVAADQAIKAAFNFRALADTYPDLRIRHGSPADEQIAARRRQLPIGRTNPPKP